MSSSALAKSSSRKNERNKGHGKRRRSTASVALSLLAAVQRALRPLRCCGGEALAPA